jgi:hypothetical protein
VYLGGLAPGCLVLTSVPPLLPPRASLASSVELDLTLSVSELGKWVAVPGASESPTVKDQLLKSPIHHRLLLWSNTTNYLREQKRRNKDHTKHKPRFYYH